MRTVIRPAVSKMPPLPPPCKTLKRGAFHAHAKSAPVYSSMTHSGTAEGSVARCLRESHGPMARMGLHTAARARWVRTPRAVVEPSYCGVRVSLLGEQRVDGEELEGSKPPRDHVDVVIHASAATQELRRPTFGDDVRVRAKGTHRDVQSWAQPLGPAQSALRTHRVAARAGG